MADDVSAPAPAPPPCAPTASRTILGNILVFTSYSLRFPLVQGHTSYVNTATYMHDGAKVVTGSADGTVKVRGVPRRMAYDSREDGLCFARLWFMIAREDACFNL